MGCCSCAQLHVYYSFIADLNRASHAHVHAKQGATPASAAAFSIPQLTPSQHRSINSVPGSPSRHCAKFAWSSCMCKVWPAPQINSRRAHTSLCLSFSLFQAPANRGCEPTGVCVHMPVLHPGSDMLGPRCCCSLCRSTFLIGVTHPSNQYGSWQ